MIVILCFLLYYLLCVHVRCLLNRPRREEMKPLTPHAISTFLWYNFTLPHAQAYNILLGLKLQVSLSKLPNMTTLLHYIYKTVIYLWKETGQSFKVMGSGAQASTLWVRLLFCNKPISYIMSLIVLITFIFKEYFKEKKIHSVWLLGIPSFI